MSDIESAGTSDEGTQQTEDTATAQGTDTSGTQGTEAPASGIAGDSQPHNDTTTTDATTADKVTAGGTQDPASAKAAPDTANPWDSDENPYRKRFNDTLSHAQQLYQEKQQRDRQLAEIQQKLTESEQAKAKEAERANLKRWNAGHPEYSKFRTLSERAQNYNRLLAKAETPDQKQMLRQMMQGEFKPEELEELEASENDRKEMIQSFTSDPRGFFAQHVQPLIQQAFEQYDAYQASRSQVQSLVGDPQNAKLIQSYAADMHRIMDPAVPSREKAFDYARLKAENDAMRAQLGKKVEQDATADARKEALTGNRQAQGNSRREGQSRVDPGQEANRRLSKRGIHPGDNRYESALAEELLRLSR